MRAFRTIPVIVSLVICCAPIWAQRPGGGARPPVSPRPIEPGGNPLSRPDPVGSLGASAEDEGKVEFRSETILVQVPVVVTDRSGNHVHNLTKNDFHVLENGKEQSIATLEEITATHAPLAVTTKPGIFTNQIADECNFATSWGGPSGDSVAFGRTRGIEDFIPAEWLRGNEHGRNRGTRRALKAHAV